MLVLRRREGGVKVVRGAQSGADMWVDGTDARFTRWCCGRGTDRSVMVVKHRLKHTEVALSLYG